MEEIRKDFPQLSCDYIYLDSAATSLKPQCVIDRISNFYTNENSNIHRGLYDLSVNTTEKYENAREIVAKFINANSDEIIFTHGCTDSINLLASGLSFTESDEIIISIAEHHSNMLPWRNTNAAISYIYCDENFIFDDGELAKITRKTKLVAISAYSNVLGANTSLKTIIKKAHKVGALVVIDAAQAIAHSRIDVKELDADFLAFSGHKIYGPTGIGVLYGKRELLEKLKPGQFGGEMVNDVTEDSVTLTEIPNRFEAGTPNIAGALGLASAINYLESHDFDALLEYERKLCTYAFNKLSNIPYLELAGAARTFNIHSSVLCFWLSNVHSHDIASYLNENHIYVRAGFHCAQPLLEHLNRGTTTRVSLSFYNTFEEIDELVSTLETVRKVMGYDE